MVEMYVAGERRLTNNVVQIRKRKKKKNLKEKVLFDFR